jgi:hypothetical protein
MKESGNDYVLEAGPSGTLKSIIRDMLKIEVDRKQKTINDKYEDTDGTTLQVLKQMSRPDPNTVNFVVKHKSQPAVSMAAGFT